MIEIKVGQIWLCRSGSTGKVTEVSGVDSVFPVKAMFDGLAGESSYELTFTKYGRFYEDETGRLIEHHRDFIKLLDKSEYPEEYV